MSKDILEKYARRGFFRDLLFNKIKDDKDVSSHIKMLGITSQPNTVMTFFIDNYKLLMVDENESIKNSMQLKFLESINAAVIGYEALVINTEENICALLLKIENDDLRIAKESIAIGEDIKQQVQNAMGISVCVGIGGHRNNILDLHLSYREALIAGWHKFYLGDAKVIHIQNTVSFSDELNLCSRDLETEISSILFRCEVGEIYKLLDEILGKTLVDRRVSPAIAKAFSIYIMSILMKTAYSGGVDYSNLNKTCSQIIRGILLCDGFIYLRDCLRLFSRQVIEALSNSRKHRNNRVFERAVDYINQHYNEELSLEKISKQIYISPYYLSHCFKDFTGISFNEYIKKLRIEEAKTLLLTTNLAVGEIGKRVGYCDPNYFGRVFKNTVGMAPSKYRSRSVFT